MLPFDLDQICQLALFAGLAPETLLDLTKGAFLQMFSAGTMLFEQGDLADFLHVVMDGSVALLGFTAPGRQSTIEVIEPVEMFMPEAVLTATPYLVSAKVLKPARVLMLQADAVRRHARDDRAFAEAASLSLSRQYSALVRQAKDVKLRTATQRLGCYLLALDAKSGGARRVRLPYEKRVIADLLGMTAESLSRAFGELRKFGVQSVGRAVVMRDPAALRAYCLPDPLDEVGSAQPMIG
jgi:CRP/FNR family transcriptional activator FtrB